MRITNTRWVDFGRKNFMLEVHIKSSFYVQNRYNRYWWNTLGPMELEACLNFAMDWLSAQAAVKLYRTASVDLRAGSPQNHLSHGWVCQWQTNFALRCYETKGKGNVCHCISPPVINICNQQFARFHQTRKISEWRRQRCISFIKVKQTVHIWFPLSVLTGQLVRWLVWIINNEWLSQAVFSISTSTDLISVFDSV